jgi:hypothetical protein
MNTINELASLQSRVEDAHNKVLEAIKALNGIRNLNGTESMILTTSIAIDALELVLMDIYEVAMEGILNAEEVEA